MKRYLFLTVAAIACGALFVGCNEKKENNPNSKRCWEITYAVTVEGYTVSHNSYVWGTEADVKEAIKEAETEAAKDGVEAKFTYAKAEANDEDACKEMNKGSEPDPGIEQPKDYEQYDNSTFKCWKVTIKSYGTELVNYVWSSERVLVKTMDESAQIGKFTYTYEESDANDQDSCEAQDAGEREETEACWKMIVTIAGQTDESYYWGTEAEAQVQVNAINSTGMGTASYTKASANDPDSCGE